jgi:predicted nucleotidyltransferase component of viral defense system
VVVTLDELRIIAGEKGFDIVLLEKDYLVTYLLYLLKDVKNIHFKGGTALNKILLNHQRLSEDIDFTLTGKLSEVEAEIKAKLKGTMFDKITHDKRVDQFVRLIAHYRLFHEEGTIFIDLNERAKLLLKPKMMQIPHFYPEHIPMFGISCIHRNEMIAEKVMAVCQRYKPRDYLDVYYIIKNNIPISISLIKRKFKENGETFSKKLIFKNTNRIFNEWNSDITRLTKSKPLFEEVMQTLKKFFKYKQ